MNDGSSSDLFVCQYSLLWHCARIHARARILPFRCACLFLSCALVLFVRVCLVRCAACGFVAEFIARAHTLRAALLPRWRARMRARTGVRAHCVRVTAWRRCVWRTRTRAPHCRALRYAVACRATPLPLARYSWACPFTWLIAVPFVRRKTEHGGTSSAARITHALPPAALHIHLPPPLCHAFGSVRARFATACALPLLRFALRGKEGTI